nr:MAG TPA: capsid scaffolding protein [Caudoviricetes sp.]
MDGNLNNQNTGVDTTIDTSTTGTETKTYTQEEVNMLLQRESDRRVSEALKKAEKKNAEKVKEAQKLA